MKKLLSLTLALLLCGALAAPVSAYDMGKTGTGNFLSAGGSFTAAIKQDGSLWTWGDSLNGALGNGGGGNDNYYYFDLRPMQTVPIQIMDHAASVSCGNLFAAAIKTDGSLWTWGNNSWGQLGSGEAEKSSIPVKIMDGVTAVSCGSSHTAAIRTDGSLWMWGDNGYGQLGNGGTGNHVYGDARYPSYLQSVPTKLMEDVAAVSCGGRHTAAIKTDGSLWMWGDNSAGQLGSGGGGDKAYGDAIYPFYLQNVPVKIMDGVTAVSCGDDFTAMLKADGSLWMCGDNTRGQLGNGGAGNDLRYYNEVHQTVPVKVMDGVSAVSCSALSHCTAAIKTDGSLWMWGDNGFGQLGNGGGWNAVYLLQNLYQNVPVKITDGVAAVSCGGHHTAAIKTDGSLWAWGDNSTGQLGNGGGGNRAYGDVVFPSYLQDTPIKIMDGVRPPADGVRTPAVSVPDIPSVPAPSEALSAQKLAVDGRIVDCERYDIDGSSYFKLRDLAAVLNETDSRFGISFDPETSTVHITTGAAYTPAGNTPAAGADHPVSAQPSSQAVLIDGVRHDELTVYNIGGSNFFQLRELANFLGFEVDFDAASNMTMVRSAQR